MKLNQDFAMAVETILYLKGRKTTDFTRTEEIAKARKFSIGYLQKVIQVLSKFGIVESKRGRIGGVRLRSKRITLLDLWDVTCGQVEFTDSSVPLMAKPLKAFGEAMKKVIVYKKP